MKGEDQPRTAKNKYIFNSY